MSFKVNKENHIGWLWFMVPLFELTPIKWLLPSLTLSRSKSKRKRTRTRTKTKIENTNKIFFIFVFFVEGNNKVQCLSNVTDNHFKHLNYKNEGEKNKFQAPFWKHKRKVEEISFNSEYFIENNQINKSNCLRCFWKKKRNYKFSNPILHSLPQVRTESLRRHSKFCCIDTSERH